MGDKSTAAHAGQGWRMVVPSGQGWHKKMASGTVRGIIHPSS